jgi:hypothetical protein
MQTLKPEKIIETISNLKQVKYIRMMKNGRLKTFQNKILEEMSKLSCQALIYLEKQSKVWDYRFPLLTKNLI